LYRAHVDLTELAVWLKAQRPRLPEVLASLPGKADDLYQEAHRAFAQDDREQAMALAQAADEAGRGLVLYLRATAAPIRGLPEPPQAESAPPRANGPQDLPAPPLEGGRPPRVPPDVRPGPWTPALVTLHDARWDLRHAGDMPQGHPAHDFLVAGVTAYNAAREAYQKGEYVKAAELARAADTWAHVPEALRRAGDARSRQGSVQSPAPRPATAPSRPDSPTAPPPPPPLEVPGR
jgi:hypothetical protein